MRDTANTSVPFCFTDRPLSVRIHRGPGEPAIRRRREPAGIGGGIPRQAGRVKAGREMREKILRLMNRSRALTSSRTVMEFQNTRNAPLRRTYSTYTLSPRRGRLSPSAVTTILLPHGLTLMSNCIFHSPSDYGYHRVYT